MAARVSLSPLETYRISTPTPLKSASTQFLNHNHPSYLVFLTNSCRYNLSLSFSTSPSSSSSSTPSFTLEDPSLTGPILSDKELQRRQLLENFNYFQELKSGLMWVQVMKAEEMDTVVELLARSFVESMNLPISFLRFMVKQYMIERRSLLPHAATLVAFYRENVDEELQPVGTVEVSFDNRGANPNPPTPTPPQDSPYICNMTVKETLRRRGIGWHLLKASEQLISQMSSKREIYLHCRMVDTAPLNLYRKAGYNIVKTDSIMILLMLQKRKHLMSKELPVLGNSIDISESNGDLPS
ncbi:Peptide alpha-N-acetyltransferase [Bertholletia excelsa]